MNGKYVGYVAGDDPLHDFLSKIIRDLMEVREPRPAFRAFRLSGSNVVYAYEEKFSRVRIICKFYGPRFGWDWDKAAWKARQEYEGLETLRQYHLVGSPHHVIRPLGFNRDINGVLALNTTPARNSVTRSARDLPPGRRASVLAAEGARLLPRDPAQPDGQWDPGRFRCGLPITSTRSRAGRGKPSASGNGTSTNSPGCAIAGGTGRRCGRTSRSGCTVTRLRRTSCSVTAWTSRRSTWNA